MSNHAFLIGGNSRGRKYAESDLSKIEKVLRDRNFSLNEIKLQSTSTEILSDLRAMLSNLTSSDNILLYFVGHGIANNNTVQLALNATEFNDDFTFLNSADIISSLAISQCSCKLMILDCCESANIYSQNFGHITDFELITVAESWQKSPEIESLKSGAFAHFFCIGLNDPSASINGLFTTHSIVTWMQQQIDDFNQKNNPRIPNIIKANGKNVHEFVLAALKDIPVCFEETLKTKLSNLLIQCEKLDIFPYSSFIYAVLLADTRSFTYTSFEKIRSSFGGTFSLLLEDFHNKLKSKEIEGKKYEKIAWIDQDYIVTALNFASSKNLSCITEQTLLHGLLSSSNNTTLKLRQLLDKDFSILSDYIQNPSGSTQIF